MGSDVNQRVGEHLRRLRKQKGLSLLEVEVSSEKEFKASVLGAYERGERAISAGRLARLAELYRLPLQAMLPADQPVSADAAAVALDVTTLEASAAPEAKTVARYVRMLQAQRGEWTGRVMRIRGEDVRALAFAVEKTPLEFVRLLDELGVRAY
jgi:transcriptional regulator with XRE-family HTH domain